MEHGLDNLERVREIGIFGGLGDDVLRSFVGALEVSELGAGTVVFKEGESGRELFVILDGEVEVLRRSKRGHETRVAILGPGDWFGEMSILDVLPRFGDHPRPRLPDRAPPPPHPPTSFHTLYRKDLRSYSLSVLNVAREIRAASASPTGCSPSSSPPWTSTPAGARPEHTR